MVSGPQNRILRVGLRRLGRTYPSISRQALIRRYSRLARTKIRVPGVGIISSWEDFDRYHGRVRKTPRIFRLSIWQTLPEDGDHCPRRGVLEQVMVNWL